MKKRRITVFLVLGVFLSSVAAGCARKPSEGAENIKSGSAVNETGSSTWLNIDDYKSDILSTRMPVSECREKYAGDTEQAKKAEIKNISFSSCEFSPFPECQTVSVLDCVPHEITTQQSWDYIEAWLGKIGKRGQVDMESEVRVVTPKAEWDDTKETPYCYPALADHMDLELDAGDGVFVVSDEFYLMLWISMNDGKINEYLGLDEPADAAARGDYSTDIIEQGTVEKLSESSWPLIDSTLTVGEGAELVKEYFEKEGPFELAPGVEEDVPEAQIFRLKDVYGYAYKVRRMYEGMPFAYSEIRRNVQIPGIYYPNEDAKMAYVVDDGGVSAFYGYDATMLLNPLYSDTNIMSLGQAVELLGTELAGGLDVEVTRAGLEYMPYSLESGDSSIAFPCWVFDGINHVKEEEIRISVDALTGYIYYYTMPVEGMAE